MLAMIDAVIFILFQYFIIAVFSCAFYGYGKLWDGVLQLPFIDDVVLRGCLRIATGMGVFIVAMQIIGVAELLKKDVIRALVVLGVLLVFIRKNPRPAVVGSMDIGVRRSYWSFWYGAAAVLAFMAITVLTLDAPLLPPTHWDELMYHLPHVREWLAEKSITVNEWLRYPYSPYNFNLLYVAIIAFTENAGSNLIHALAGWLVVFLIFRVVKNNFGPFTAVLAAAIWISANKWFFKTSYIELGVALFVFSSTVYFILWIQDGSKQSSLLVTAAFFLGLAAGTKYQAAIYPPFFIVAALLYERKPFTWLKVSIAFLIPCVFWYLRNLLVTGNPVNPLAGSIFGYYDWNEADFLYQLFDLKNSRNFPRSEIWLAFLILLFPVVWRSKAMCWMILLSIYSAVIWYFTSHYDRYLVPQYPVLALLGAVGLSYLLQLLVSFSGESERWLKIQASVVFGKVVFGIVLLVFLMQILPSVTKSLARIPIGAEARHAYINANAQNFGILVSLQANYSNEKIYQLGLEGGLFYGPRRIYGDHFGPWRYRDFEPLSAPDLHKKLRDNNFTVLAVHRNSVNGIEGKPKFHDYFEEIIGSNGDKAYRLLDIKKFF